QIYHNNSGNTIDVDVPWVIYPPVEGTKFDPISVYFQWNVDPKQKDGKSFIHPPNSGDKSPQITPDYIKLTIFLQAYYPGVLGIGGHHSGAGTASVWFTYCGA